MRTDLICAKRGASPFRAAGLRVALKLKHPRPTLSSRHGQSGEPCAPDRISPPIETQLSRSSAPFRPRTRGIIRATTLPKTPRTHIRRRTVHLFLLRRLLISWCSASGPTETEPLSTTARNRINTSTEHFECQNAKSTQTRLNSILKEKGGGASVCGWGTQSHTSGFTSSLKGLQKNKVVRRRCNGSKTGWRCNGSKTGWT